MKRSVKILLSTLAVGIVTVLCLSYLYASSSDDDVVDNAYTAEHCPHASRGAMTGAKCPYVSAQSGSREHHSSCAKWAKDGCEEMSGCDAEKMEQCEHMSGCDAEEMEQCKHMAGYDVEKMEQCAHMSGCDAEEMEQCKHMSGCDAGMKAVCPHQCESKPRTTTESETSSASPSFQ